MITECQVLNSILQERNARLQEKGKEVLSKCGLAPTLYSLAFDVEKDAWEARVKTEGLIIPNRQQRRAG